MEDAKSSGPKSPHSGKPQSTSSTRGEEKKEDVIDISQDIDTKNADKPLRIIAINEAGTKFVLIEENLRAIVERAEKINSQKIVIVSVVGAFRTGKSFLLDFFLRFLRSPEMEESVPVGSMERVPTWVTSGADRLAEGAADGDAMPGFLWRPGKDRTTTGIWMYGSPFERTLPSGEKVAVLLMDTQGMFDLKTSQELTAAIFGLSTLISSYQVYNLTKQIQEDHLQELDYFTQFSLVALKEFEKSQTRKKSSSKKMHAFQSMDFLVRDWQNFEDDHNIAKCLKEMPSVLENALDQNIKDDGTREAIKNAFDDIGCFLLPHPGIAMTRPQYKGSIKDLEKNFLALLDIYVHRVFKDKVVTKKIQGREVSPRDLLRFIVAYSEVFKEGHLPKPLTLVQAISLTTNLCAKDNALAQYKQQMNALCGTDSAVATDKLNEAHQAAVDNIFAYFDNTATFGDESQIRETRLTLLKAIEEEFQNLQKMNQYKLQGGLVKLIIPLMVAMAALTLDLVSDWTCDPWSQTCRKISQYLAFMYYGVLFWMLFEFYRLYRSQGSIAVGVGAMALGQATLNKMGNISKSISQRLTPEALSKLKMDKREGSEVELSDIKKKKKQ